MRKLEETEVVEEKQPFEIKDIGDVTWVMREILAPLKVRVEQTKQLEQAEIDRIKLWAENENRSPLQDIEYWEQRIADYHLELLDKDPKQKTLSTPYGKSSSRRSKAAPEKVDEDKLLEHVKSNNLNDFVQVKESIKWGDFKKTLNISGDKVYDGNGLEVEGATVKPETVICKVEVL